MVQMKRSTRVLDEWLALRCKAGDSGAFGDLISEMERPLLYYATKLTGSEDKALDILQEVWLRALPGIRKLKDPASVRAWLYTVAHAAAIDQFRQQRARERAEEVHIEAADTDIAFDPGDAALIHQALDRIETKHREVLVLFFLEDFSLDEIAQILNCPQGTVKSRLFYAKKALRDAITGEAYANTQ